jgi:hypothetical protein
MAMLLVCISHFGLNYFGPLKDSREAIGTAIAAPSTPMFVFMSGLLLGFLYARAPASFPDLSLKLMDRGLFLLLPTHLLSRLAHLGAFRSIHFFFITDAIGVCLLVGPWLVANLSARRRLAVGIGLLTLTWILYFAWAPTASFGQALQAIFVGRVPGTNGWLAFPALPWLGFYVVATTLGERVPSWGRPGPVLVKQLLRLGVVAGVVGLALFLFGRGQSPVIRTLLSARQKYPPSVSYLLLSGGLALVVLATVAALEWRNALTPLISAFAVVGRSSLVVFIAQDFIYYTGLWVLRLPASPWWPLYFLVSVGMIFGFAQLWDRYLGNRYLTVGLVYLVRRPARATSVEPKSPPIG